MKLVWWSQYLLSGSYCQGVGDNSSLLVEVLSSMGEDSEFNDGSEAAMICVDISMKMKFAWVDE